MYKIYQYKNTVFIPVWEGEILQCFKGLCKAHSLLEHLLLKLHTLVSALFF